MGLEMSQGSAFPHSLDDSASSHGLPPASSFLVAWPRHLDPPPLTVGWGPRPTMGADGGGGGSNERDGGARATTGGLPAVGGGLGWGWGRSLALVQVLQPAELLQELGPGVAVVPSGARARPQRLLQHQAVGPQERVVGALFSQGGWALWGRRR